MSRRSFNNYAFILTSILIVLSMTLAACTTPATPAPVEEMPTEPAAPAPTQAPAESAATQPPTQPAPTEAPAEKEKVTLTFWKHSHTPADPLTQEIIDEYTAMNPHVTIVMELIPNVDHLTKLLTAVAGGQAPDIYDMNDTNLATFIEKGALAPINPPDVGFPDQAALEAAYVPDSLTPFKGTDGKVYALPFEYNSWTLTINDKIFQDAGLDPEKDYPKTWEEVGEIGAKLAIVNNGVFERQGFSWNLLTPGWTMLQFSPLLYQLGGSILTDDDKGNVCNLNTPEGEEALQMMKDIYYKYDASAPGVNLSTGAEPMADFVQEKIAMWYIGPWSVSMFEANPDVWDNYRIIPMPQMANAKRTVVMMSSWAWMVNSQSKHADEAWRFIDYAQQQGARWLPTAGYILPRLGWTDSPEAQEFRGLDVFTELMAYGRPRLIHPNSAEISTIIHKMVENAVLSDADVKSELQAACKEIDDLLK
jgi:multiple sugar transport system substrate-binding protein